HHHGHADSEPPATPHHSYTPAFTCPLCSSYAPAVAINSLDWSMAFIAHAPPPVPVSLDRVPALPRHLRPAINPRASPEAIRNSEQAIETVASKRPRQDEIGFETFSAPMVERRCFPWPAGTAWQLAACGRLPRPAHAYGSPHDNETCLHGTACRCLSF